MEYLNEDEFAKKGRIYVFMCSAELELGVS